MASSGAAVMATIIAAAKQVRRSEAERGMGPSAKTRQTTH